MLLIVTILVQFVAALSMPMYSGLRHGPPKHPLSLFWHLIFAAGLLMPFVWGAYLLCSYRTTSQRILAYLALIISLFWLLLDIFDVVYKINIGAQWTWM